MFLQKLAEFEKPHLIEQLQFLKEYWQRNFHRCHNSYVKQPKLEMIEKELALLHDNKLISFQRGEKYCIVICAYICIVYVYYIENVKDSNLKQETSFKYHYYQQRWPDREMSNRENRLQLCKDYLQGLQWVLDYFYQGVPSWSWHYPHYYAPLVSDMAFVGKDLTCHFALGEPLLPFEHSLTLLPIASSKLLPEPFRNLMTDPKSPIVHLYPTSFKIDLDYATNPWEGIALLPFVDERKIKEAVATIDPLTQLTEEEKMRNRRTYTQMLQFDPERAKQRRRIPGPQTFGSMNDVVSNCRFVEPPIEVNQGKFFPEPCKGSYAPLQGFPQLSIMRFSTATKKIGCKIFGLKSKYETMVLSIQQMWSRSSEKQPKYEELERTAWDFLCLNETCFVEWPYLREAKVLMVETVARKFYFDNERQPIATNKSQEEYFQFHKETTKLQQHYLTTLGIDCGVIHILVTVRLINGMKRRTTLHSHFRYPNGMQQHRQHAIKMWGNENMVVPLQFIVKRDTSSLVIDRRFIDKKINTESELQVGTAVMYIGSIREYFGKVGRVMKEPEQNTVDIRVMGRFEHKDFAYDIIKEHRRKLKYYSINEAADLVKVSPSVFSRICGVVTVRHLKQDLDLGLKLKLSSHGLVVPGYARAAPVSLQQQQQYFPGREGQEEEDFYSTYRPVHEWKGMHYQIEFSEKTVELLLAYKEKFPLLFRLLHSAPGYKFFSDQFSTLQVWLYLRDFIYVYTSGAYASDTAEKTESGIESDVHGEADGQKDVPKSKVSTQSKEQIHGLEAKTTG
ncbi:5'-3' exonuclease [Reticulomyxa filosa]|uniref:5'-3' exonuclease n=1 Tax=Reticulomyxa filosa TaxID=46433 RepID=X6M3H7_RETFI|nr:5'-3' exonuclease [Reticulomyxa filosa]|eukprot:ETO08479.1 5'-3' exonuclease [Reticulomyxa filosa]